MAYRATFACLWCGTDWKTRGPDDLEGWAALCPECLGNAGQNPFLRGRLRSALEARGVRRAVTEQAAPTGRLVVPSEASRSAGASARSSARLAQPPVALPDAWFLRRAPYDRGAIHDAAWDAELDMVTRWLDSLPLGGRILEPAAGVGFFSPLLAEKGELHASDPDGDALDLARERLLAHKLLAHLHVRDPWSLPAPAEPKGDALVAAFLLGRVRGAGLDVAARSLRERIREGGRLAVIDLRPDPAGGPGTGMTWTYHAPELLEAALARAGFGDLEVRTTGRFFLLATALAL